MGQFSVWQGCLSSRRLGRGCLSSCLNPGTRGLSFKLHGVVRGKAVSQAISIVGESSPAPQGGRAIFQAEGGQGEGCLSGYLICGEGLSSSPAPKAVGGCLSSCWWSSLGRLSLKPSVSRGGSVHLWHPPRAVFQAVGLIGISRFSAGRALFQAISFVNVGGRFISGTGRNSQLVVFKKSVQTNRRRGSPSCAAADFLCTPEPLGPLRAHAPDRGCWRRRPIVVGEG